jgi:uncharacterized protein involved in type VI secretion and phage assembly
VRAGDTVNLEESDAFAMPTQGTLGVTKVVHVFTEQQYRNDFEATAWTGYSNPVQPPRNTTLGCATGDVVDNVDPATMGRIKVRFRWNDASESTRWVRVASIYAGNGRGVMFLPEIGDEVVVTFENGDPERPIVIGALWNGTDLAPSEDQNKVKRIITRSGNTIQLFDDPSNERIEIFSPEGKCWVQLHNNGGNPLLTIHSEGDIAIEAKQELRIKCQTLIQDVGSDAMTSVGGSATTSVSGDVLSTAGGKYAIEGMNIVLKATMMFDAVAGAVASMIGAMVHLQPPGKVVPPNMGKPMPPGKSAWKSQETPKAGDGKTSADPKQSR